MIYHAPATGTDLREGGGVRQYGRNETDFNMRTLLPYALKFSGDCVKLPSLSYGRLLV
jgi:hypothetical protein